MMMNTDDPCGAFRDALMDFVDGTLPAAELDAARAHERACPECASLALTVRGQASLLSRVRRPLPPPDLGLRIERALGSRGAVVRPRRWGAWTAAAAAGLVAAIGLLGVPSRRAAERSVHVVDVELPERGSFLGQISPNLDNPGASLLDPLVTGENP
jgi:hypothetical protein